MTEISQTSPQPNVPERHLSIRLGALVLLTGAGAGLAGGLLMRLLDLMQRLSFHAVGGDLLKGVEASSSARRVAVLLLAGLIAAATLWSIKRIWPKGSGPGLSSAIWRRNGELAIGPTLLKGVLSIVTVGMGLALGREGALKDTGGVWANRLSHWFRLSPAEQTLLVACGAGAGMAAAYNVPLGGALFAAEVLLGGMSLATVLPAFAASFMGVAFSWLLLPNAPAYQFPELPATRSLLLWSLLIGPVAGLISVPWVRAIAWAQTHRPAGWQVLALPVLIFTALGAAATRFPELLGNGKDLIQLTFTSPLSLPLLVCLLVLRPLFSVLCLRTGAPGGLFTPTMTLGALLGSLACRVWNGVLPANDASSCALIGSGAVLAAATLGPLSSAVFVLELTRHADSLMVPLLMAVVGATVTSRAVESRSIYSARE